MRARQQSREHAREGSNARLLVFFLRTRSLVRPLEATRRPDGPDGPVRASLVLATFATWSTTVVEMEGEKARVLCLALLCLAAGLVPGVAAQQRSSSLQWSAQTLSAGHFNVHTVSVFTAAESLEVVLKAQRIEGFGGLNVWLRHGSPPTPEQHHVHAVLHGGSRGRGSKMHDVGLHVKNPLQGEWYIAVAPEVAGEFAETPAMEVTEHQFIQEPGSATYSIDATAAGCDRGRFGFPHCASTWMELSWGKEAQFHGKLGAGKDVWTCSMYEVAPYTSHVAFTLISPGKQHMKHATPQIYARYHAYPTLNEYDATTAVNGNAWQASHLLDYAIFTQPRE